jgi:molybdate transport system substrate-binding protein
MRRTSDLFAVPVATLLFVAVGSVAVASTPERATTAGATSEAPTGSAPVLAGDITVFAAASLTESFTDIGEAFTAANPDATATFSFDASSALVQQIIEGAPADLFASADAANMDKLTDAGLNGTEPVVFATNLLTIIVAPDNPLGITGVEDLANPDLNVVVCAAEVPCGNYANQIFDAAGVEVTPVSLEQNVRGVSTKVTEGEADAGIVYATDVIAAGDDAAMVEIPEDINFIAEYPVAAVAASEYPDVDQAFIDFMLGDEAQAILAEYGFGPPTGATAPGTTELTTTETPAASVPAETEVAETEAPPTSAA